IAVVPGQLGIGVFSPLLDNRGNSVRGIAVCNELSRSLDVHLFNRPNPGRSMIRLKFNGASLNSKRVRCAQEREALQKFGAAIQGYQPQEYSTFANTKFIIRDILDSLESKDYVVLNLKRVVDLNKSAARLLYQLLLKLSPVSKATVFTHAERFP